MRHMPRDGAGPDEVQADQAAAWFRASFGQAAAGVWRAPGRVNLIGEHTDYNDGFVLPFAIRQGVCIAAAPRDDGQLELCSRQQPEDRVLVPVAALGPGAVGGWAAYPAGVAWALGEAGYPVAGASLAIDADVPQGAGLSSSAALECATALALTDMAGLAVARTELATLARRAENLFVGVPSGIMDQSAALLCQERSALLLDCRSGQTEAVPLDPARLGLVLVVIDTRARHALTDGRYADRRRECEQAAALLRVGSLRDLTAADLDRLAGHAVLRRRAAHVVTENDRVRAAARLLRTEALTECGDLLTASHRSLRDDFEVSWPQADAAVEAALAAGAPGARMVGGGFGGSVLALAPADREHALRAAVQRAYDRLGWPAPAFTTVLPAAAGHRVR
jgi:galactokinase